MKIPQIINIQKFSIHDGDGIRTTVFFKGCPLSCKWCHNPESQSYNKELMLYADRCTGCGLCVNSCEQNAISIKDGIMNTDYTLCKACGVCTQECPHEVRFIIGKEYSVDELVKLLYKDYTFYEQSGGGVTLSGGEVMCQDIDYICELLKKLKKKGINTAIDTCGYAPFQNFVKILPYVDTFLYDIKAFNKDVHNQFMGKDNVIILENLKQLASLGANINIRIPLIENVNTSDEEVLGIIDFVQKNVGYAKINLLPYHNTGKDKYQRLHLIYDDDSFSKPSDEKIEQVKNKWIAANFTQVKIGG